MTTAPPQVNPTWSRAAWTALVPIRRRGAGKSRLHDLPEREELAAAMAGDVLDTVRATPLVSRTYVVTDDPDITRWLAVSPGEVLAGGWGLNEDLERAAGQLRAPDRIVVVMADLPALRPAGLERVLVHAQPRARGVVADASGAGTTMLVASAGPALRPCFGNGSFGRHLGTGAADLTPWADPGTRSDVDTASDLDDVREQGLDIGVRTAAVLERMRA